MKRIKTEALTDSGKRRECRGEIMALRVLDAKKKGWRLFLFFHWSVFGVFLTVRSGPSNIRIKMARFKGCCGCIISLRLSSVFIYSYIANHGSILGISCLL